VGAPIPGFRASHASIDASGGTLTSPDGQLTVTVPAGALSGATNLSITPIENTAPGGVGYAYDLEPNGTTFTQPVTLTYAPRYGQLDEATSTYDNVAVAFQHDDGTWEPLDAVTADVAHQRFSATTTHFTDFATLLLLNLHADKTALLSGQSTGLTVDSVSRLDGPFAGIRLGGQVALNITGTPSWMLNDSATLGVAGADGTLDVIGNGGNYTAPSQDPTNNPERITVKYTADKGGQVTLVSSIYVLAHKYNLEFTLREAGACSAAQPAVAYSLDASATSNIDISLDDALNVSTGAAGPQGAPTVSNTACCVMNAGYTCTATFDAASEPFSFQLTSATGGWDALNHRLKVVPKGLDKVFPTLDVTTTVGTMTNMFKVNDDMPGSWNDYNYVYLLNGGDSANTETLDTSTTAYTGSIVGSLTATSF